MRAECPTPGAAVGCAGGRAGSQPPSDGADGLAELFESVIRVLGDVVAIPSQLVEGVAHQRRWMSSVAQSPPDDALPETTDSGARGLQREARQLRLHADRLIRQSATLTARAEHLTSQADSLLRRSSASGADPDATA